MGRSSSDKPDRRMRNNTSSSARALAWLPAIAMMALILSASSQPALGNERFLWDELVALLGQPEWLLSLRPLIDLADHVRSPIGHLVEYGLLALAFAFAWNRQPATASHAGILAIVSAACFALVDELYQSIVPNRYPSFGDVLWDWLGAFLAVALMHLYRHLTWKRQPRILPRA